MQTFAHFIANNARAADRLRSFFSRIDHPGLISFLVQGDHPGDPGAWITAQVLRSDLIQASAADQLSELALCAAAPSKPDTGGPIVHAADSAIDQIVRACTIKKKGGQGPPGTWRSCAWIK